MPRDTRLDRRTFVRTVAAASALPAVAGCLGGSDGTDDGGSGGDSGGSGGDGGGSGDSGGSGDDGSGGDDPSPEGFGGWFDNVSNYDGVADHTGESEVTVQVGASGNGGSFAFAPPAIRIDSGTTVVWEWTGDGGTHNVAAEDGSFESELTGEAGHTFEHTFDASGTVKYACTPHRPVGMRGVVVVE